MKNIVKISVILLPVILVTLVEGCISNNYLAPTPMLTVTPTPTPTPIAPVTPSTVAPYLEQQQDAPLHVIYGSYGGCNQYTVELSALDGYQLCVPTSADGSFVIDARTTSNCYSISVYADDGGKLVYNDPSIRTFSPTGTDHITLQASGNL